MSRLIRVAIVGCGRMGTARAQAAKDFGAHVAIVCDADPAIASELANRHRGCEIVGSPLELDWSSLDAVFVCTPPSERGEVELAAIGRGVPFFVEKPPGLRAAKLTKVSDALQANPTLNAVGYMNRYRQSVQDVRTWTRQRKVLGMSVDWMVGMYGVPWWSQLDGSGGPVNEQATHIVDLARYLVGEVVSVQAMGVPMPKRRELIGSAVINLLFQSGQVCSMMYSCLAAEKMIRLQIYSAAEEAGLCGWDFRRVGDHSTVAPHSERNQIFSVETSAFLDAVEQRSANGIRCDFHDAVQTQRVVDAIHRAITSGRTETIGGEE